MKTGNSVKVRCSYCKIFYKYHKLYCICRKKRRHNKRQK